MKFFGKETPIIIGTTHIFICPLERYERTRGRDAERRAVAALVEQATGGRGKLTHEASGAPHIEGMDLNVSVSHGAGMAVLATDPKRPIGVDIECWRPQLKRVAGKFLNERERQHYEQDPKNLLRAWCLKEAIFKAAGIDGLTIGAIELPDIIGPRIDVPGIGQFDVTELLDGDICLIICAAVCSIDEA